MKKHNNPNPNGPSRHGRRENTKRIAGKPIVRQMGKNGGKRTAPKKKDRRG
jgi:hypothetical protein